MNIKKLADSLAQKHQSRDPFEVIQGLNVILVFTPLIGARAFYQFFQRNNIIYIDNSLSRHEQTFECAHEMGHMFMHKKSNTIFMDTKTCFNTCRFENEADTFAMDFLVDDSTLLEYSGYSIAQISRILGYDKRLMELRINSINKKE